MSTPPRSGAKPGGMVFAVIFGFLGVLIVAGSYSVHSEMNNWLSRQAEQTITIDPSFVDPENDGKLVHVIGSVSSSPHEYDDSAFGVRGRGVAMVRQTLEFGYAGGDGGGGDGWYPHREPSVFGDAPAASQDRFRTAVWIPSTVHVGAFTLDDSLVRSYLRQKFPHTRSRSAAPPNSGRTASDDVRLHLESAAWDMRTYRELTFAKDPAGAPNYGDKRVLYRVFVLDAQPVTIVCRQSGDRLDPVSGYRGGPFFRLILGPVARDQAFVAARQTARRDCLIVGGIGVVLMLVAIGVFVRR